MIQENPVHLLQQTTTAKAIKSPTPVSERIADITSTVNGNFLWSANEEEYVLYNFRQACVSLIN